MQAVTLTEKGTEAGGPGRHMLRPALRLRQFERRHHKCAGELLGPQGLAVEQVEDAEAVAIAA
jgi:hypothetical protein